MRKIVEQSPYKLCRSMTLTGDLDGALAELPEAFNRNVLEFIRGH